MALIELADQAEQFLLRGLGRKGVLFAVKAALRARLFLVADIDLARRVVSHDDDRQAGVTPFFLSSSVSAKMLLRTLAESALPSILTALMVYPPLCCQRG